MARSFLLSTRTENEEVLDGEAGEMQTIEAADVEHGANEIQEDIDKIEDHINATSELEEVTEQMGTNIAAIEAEGPSEEMEAVKAESDNPEQIEANIEESANAEVVPTLDKETVENSPTIVQEQLVEAQVAGEAYARIVSGARYKDLARHYNISYVKTESITRGNKPYKQYILQHEGFMEMIKKAYIAVRNFIIKCINRITRWMQEIRLYFNNIEKDIKALEEKITAIKNGANYSSTNLFSNMDDSENPYLWFLATPDPAAILKYHFKKLEDVGNKKDLSKLVDIKAAKAAIKGPGFFSKLVGYAFPNFGKNSTVFSQKEVNDLFKVNKNYSSYLTEAGKNSENVLMLYCYFKRDTANCCFAIFNGSTKRDKDDFSEFTIRTEVKQFSLSEGSNEGRMLNGSFTGKDAVKALEAIVKELKANAGKFPDMVKKAIAALEVFKNSNLEKTDAGLSKEDAMFYKAMMKVANSSAVGINGIISGTYSQISWAMSAANRFAKVYTAKNG